MMTVWHGFLRLFITSSTFLSLNTTTMMDFEAQECLPMLISFLFVRSLWHSQAGDSIPKFNRWISNFMSLNIFSTWDNIWLFNGATYFMKSTNKYFVTSRAHHKKSQFYWNPIINKSSFVDVTMIVFEMMMTSFPPRERQIELSDAAARLKNIPSTVPRKKKVSASRCKVSLNLTANLFSHLSTRINSRARKLQKIPFENFVSKSQHTRSQKEFHDGSIFICFLFSSTCARYAFETECLLRYQPGLLGNITKRSPAFMFSGLELELCSS